MEDWPISELTLSFDLWSRSLRQERTPQWTAPSIKTNQWTPRKTCTTCSTIKKSTTTRRCFKPHQYLRLFLSQQCPWSHIATCKAWVELKIQARCQSTWKPWIPTISLNKFSTITHFIIASRPWFHTRRRSPPWWSHTKTIIPSYQKWRRKNSNTAKTWPALSKRYQQQTSQSQKAFIRRSYSNARAPIMCTTATA